MKRCSLGASVPSRPEAEAILERVHESIHHAAVVTGIGIQHRDPIEIKRIWITTQIPKVLHHHKRLVVVPVVNLCALRNLPQHLRSCPSAIAQGSNPEVTSDMGNARRREQRVDILRVTQPVELRHESWPAHEVSDESLLRSFQLCITQEP